MKLYLQYFSMLVRCQMQYKFSFWMMVVGHFFMSFSLFFSIFFLFSRFGEVDGFTFPEILLCFAVVSMAFSSAECFARGFDVFPRLIKSGDLDRILLRPRSVIFQVLCSNIPGWGGFCRRCWFCSMPFCPAGLHGPLIKLSRCFWCWPAALLPFRHYLFCTRHSAFLL